jgi:hypothetical protein
VKVAVSRPLPPNSRSVPTAYSWPGVTAEPISSDSVLSVAVVVDASKIATAESSAAVAVADAGAVAWATALRRPSITANLGRLDVRRGAAGDRSEPVLAALLARPADVLQVQAGVTGVLVTRCAVMPGSMVRPGGANVAQAERSPEESADHRAPRADRTTRLGELVKAMCVHLGVHSGVEADATGARQPIEAVSIGYGAGVASVPIPAISSAGITSGSPLASTNVPRTTVSSSPAPRAVWTTSSS